MADALTVVQSVTLFVLGHAPAQVGTPPGAEPEAAEPAAAADDYYERWFAAGLIAMLRGFAEPGRP